MTFPSVVGRHAPEAQRSTESPRWAAALRGVLDARQQGWGDSQLYAGMSVLDDQRDARQGGYDVPMIMYPAEKRLEIHVPLT
jgi:hypothetical protein